MIFACICLDQIQFMYQTNHIRKFKFFKRLIIYTKLNTSVNFKLNQMDHNLKCVLCNDFLFVFKLNVNFSNFLNK